MKTLYKKAYQKNVLVSSLNSGKMMRKINWKFFKVSATPRCTYSERCYCCIYSEKFHPPVKNAWMAVYHLNQLDYLTCQPCCLCQGPVAVGDACSLDLRSAAVR